MTAFSASDLPSQINSLEELAAWATATLAALYPTEFILEAPRVEEQVATSNPFQILASGTPDWRLISRTSLKLPEDWQGKGRPWELVQPIGTLPIPTEFKS
jgi:hypothetical protein